MCMTHTDTDDRQLTRQALAVEGRSVPLKVTGKLKNALMLMVWDGQDRKTAADGAGLADHSLREALRKPHVKRFYLDQIDVLRTSQRAKNIHRAMQIRDKADNMPAMHAIKFLEGIADDDADARKSQSPGVTIIIEAAKREQDVRVIDVKADNVD